MKDTPSTIHKFSGFTLSLGKLGKQDQGIDPTEGGKFNRNRISRKFVRVISNSRYSRRPDCIWEGEVKVLMEIAEYGESFEK